MATVNSPAAVDPQALQTFLDGDDAEVRDIVREWLSRPGNGPAGAELSMEAHRAQVLAWTQELAADGRTALGYPVQYGGMGDVGASIAAFETIAFGDLSLLVKLGVQFGLFGGAVLHLGTEVHHRRYLADIAAMRLPGCFAMTETGHGSNVQALETTATYDADAQEFVVPERLQVHLDAERLETMRDAGVGEVVTRDHGGRHLPQRADGPQLLQQCETIRFRQVQIDQQRRRFERQQGRQLCLRPRVDHHGIAVRGQHLLEQECRELIVLDDHDERRGIVQGVTDL